jgi:hypothetical protein
MRRIGFRRILPLVFTAIDVALVLLSAQQTRTLASSPRNTQYHRLAYQEGGGAMAVDPLYEPPPLKPIQKAAIILDLPIFILAAPTAAFLLPRSETAVYYLSIPLVPFLWYGIGRWLDGMVGYMQRLRLNRTLRGLIGIPGAGLLCVSAMIFTPAYHHRTADTYWIGTGIMLWSGLSLAIALSTKKAD